MDVPRLRGRLPQLLTEPREVHVDGLVGASVRLVPYLGQQLALAYHPTGTFNEVHEEFEFSRRKVERLVLKLRFLRVEIDDDLSNDHRPLLRFRPRSSEDRAEAGLEMLRRIGLHDVVIGACVEQSDDLRFVVSSCGNNHRHIGDGTDHSERLSSVEIGETKIEHDDVEPARNRCLDARHGGSNGIHLVASLRKATGQRLPNALIVLNYQDGGHSVTIPNHPASTGNRPAFHPRLTDRYPWNGQGQA